MLTKGIYNDTVTGIPGDEKLCQIGAKKRHLTTLALAVGDWFDRQA